MPSAGDLLKKDHRKVEELFARFRQTHDESVATEICDELTIHTRVEEQVLYPAVRNEMTDGGKLTNEAEKEHSEAKGLIGRIRRTSNPEHLAELMTELETAVQHHVHEEESEMLPKAERELGEGRMTEMGKEIADAKAHVGV